MKKNEEEEEKKIFFFFIEKKTAFFYRREEEIKNLIDGEYFRISLFYVKLFRYCTVNYKNNIFI
jgi:hypothetical protein